MKVLRRVTAAAALAVAVLVAPAPVAATASAAACSGGALVVVDPGRLGGDAQHVCVPSDGVATELFDDAGVALEYDPRTPGYVCRVDGRPVDRSCTGVDSYWSLWWADGDGGDWIYADLGVASLEVPAGGSVGLAWHQGDGDAAPPDLPPDTASAASDAAGGSAAEARADADQGGQQQEGGTGVWIAGVAAVLVLGAAAVVPLRRRRSR